MKKLTRYEKMILFPRDLVISDFFGKYRKTEVAKIQENFKKIVENNPNLSRFKKPKL